MVATTITTVVLYNRTSVKTKTADKCASTLRYDHNITYYQDLIKGGGALAPGRELKGTTMSRQIFFLMASAIKQKCIIISKILTKLLKH